MRYVLGSRSPRRMELLRLLLPHAQIDVLPPSDPGEAGFDGLERLDELYERVQLIARTKLQDVQRQLAVNHEGQTEPVTVICADTTVVVSTGENCYRVLGQPPAQPGWQQEVADWFSRHYAGQTHFVATALCVAFPDGRVVERLDQTSVTFRPDTDRWLEWYLGTGESVGKAGGYALQAAGSVFVQSVHGSLSNVIGLPLEVLADVLEVLR
jgi:septum formation protein